MPNYGYGKWDQAPFPRFDRLDHYSEKELEKWYIRSKIEHNFETAKYMRTKSNILGKLLIVGCIGCLCYGYNWYKSCSKN